jgi:hypothetical protein
MGLTYILRPKCNKFHLTCPVQYILQIISLHLPKCSDLSSVNAASCYVGVFCFVFFILTTAGISASIPIIEGHLVAVAVRYIGIWFPGYA